MQFDKVSATHIVAVPELGSNDLQKKDLASGDLNGDGWLDLVILRKTPFSTPGDQANVLFINDFGTMIERRAEYAPAFADATDDRDAALADVNGNGRLHVITAPTFGNPPRVYIDRA